MYAKDFTNELIKRRSQLEDEILLYKQVLSESMEKNLVRSLNHFEPQIKEQMNYLTKKRRSSISIILTTETIYKSPFTNGEKNSLFSIEYCIHDYVFKNSLFGLLKKQVHFTDINYKKLTLSLWSELGIDGMDSLLLEVYTENPKIEESLRKHYEQLGFSVELIKRTYHVLLELTWHPSPDS